MHSRRSPNIAPTPSSSVSSPSPTHSSPTPARSSPLDIPLRSLRNDLNTSMSRIRSASPSPEEQSLLPTRSVDQDQVDKESSEVSSWKLSSLDMVPSQKDRLAFVLILTGLAAFLPLTWYITLSTGFSAGWFTFHPPLNSLAITMFILGITPIQPPPSTKTIRAKRFNIHQYLLLGIAIPLMVVGTAAMILNKYVHDAAHFTTWHSWFGLSVLGWTIAQGLIGGLSVWWGGKALGGGEKAKRVYKYHRLSGYLLVSLALITAHMGGAESSWAISKKDKTIVKVLAYWIGLPLIWIGVGLRTRTSKMKFT